MKTFNRICIKSAFMEAQNGDRQEIECGREYLTSDEKDGLVVVFSTFWVPFKAELFAGEIEFTK